MGFSWGSACSQCLPSPGITIQSGSRNTLCSHGRKALQKTKPFPLRLPFPWRWGVFRSFLALFGTLFPSLAFQYHGTPHCHRFLPFSPLGISTFSSLDRACVPPLPSFSFLPLSSGTRIPAPVHQTKLPGGPNSHKHHFCLSVGNPWCTSCRKWLEMPQFWGSVPPCAAETPPGNIPTDAATCVQHTKSTLPPTPSFPGAMCEK